jgi:DNA-binding transcriptional ArsR family regulator
MVQYRSDTRLDDAFAALSDVTRRGILERLAREPASISELAAGFDMTLTGIKKHVRVLEDAGLLRTSKTGRVRTCSLGPRRLEDEIEWIERHRRSVEERLDRLGAFLERTKGGEG